jgi:hypothetical protein
VNAAFLLVTTAWFAGADPAPAATAAPAAPLGGAVSSAPMGGMGTGGCCGAAAYGSGFADGCGCCQPCCKMGFLARHRAKKCCNSCECCNTCCETSGCGGGCGANTSCGCGTCCETCCCKPSLCQRLKCRCHRNKCCCDGLNDGCCGGGCGAGVGGVGAPPAVMPSAEPIKTLPKDTSKKSGTVQSQGLGLTPASSSTVLEANPF